MESTRVTFTQTWISYKVTVAKINNSKNHWLSLFKKDFGCTSLKQQEQCPDGRQAVSGLHLHDQATHCFLIYTNSFQTRPQWCAAPHKHPQPSAGSPSSVVKSSLSWHRLEHIQSDPSTVNKTWSNRLKNVWLSAIPALCLLLGCGTVGWKQGKKLIEISNTFKSPRHPGAPQ